MLRRRAQRITKASGSKPTATAIEAHLSAGAYDEVEDGRVLADLVGRDLFEVAGDKHLKLSFSTDPLPPEPPDVPETPAERQALSDALRPSESPPARGGAAVRLT